MGKSKNAKKKAKQRAEDDLNSPNNSQQSISEQQSSPLLSSQTSSVAFPSSPPLELLSSPTLTSLDQLEPEDTSAATSLSHRHSRIASSATVVPPQSAPSMDDLALELLVAKEAESEVERLRSQVARLQKEIEFKDGMIAKLQAELTSKAGSATRPAAADTVVQNGTTTDITLRQQQQRDAALQCSICVDYFSSPCTIECGHTFCYTCLHSWVEIHKSCPTCRTKLLRRPTVSFNIREQVHASIARLPEPERTVATEKMEAEERSMKLKLNRGDIWAGIFKPISLEGFGNGTILDSEDGVRRCAACGWEVRGGACVNCSTLFSGGEDSDASQENTDSDSEPDAYDTHDSFINDTDDDEEEEDHSEPDPDVNDLELSGDSFHEDDSDDNDDADGTNVKRRRRGRQTRSSRMAPIKGANARLRRGRHVIVDISDSESDTKGSDSEERSSAEESEKGDDQEEGEDEGEDEGKDELEEAAKITSRSKSRLQQKRRAIMISDDDEVTDQDEKQRDKGKAYQPKVNGSTAFLTTSNSSSSSSNTKSDVARQAKRAMSENESSDEDKIKTTISRTNVESIHKNKSKIKDSSDDSDGSDNSDDDFAASFPRRNKRARSGNMEALFA
ncbi:E3 ubiquitin ligase [Mortierella claussenii]|nr:E3 ubiquitin ligase [Mortierella claussenii]